MEVKKTELAERVGSMTLCTRDNCPKKGSCLRHICLKYVDANRPTLRIVNPVMLKKCADNEGCDMYLSNRPRLYAKGFIRILDSLPRKERDTFALSLLSYYSRRQYFSARRGDRPIPPEESKQILDVAKQIYPLVDYDFDAYEEYYKID